MKNVVERTDVSRGVGPSGHGAGRRPGVDRGRVISVTSVSPVPVSTHRVPPVSAGLCRVRSVLHRPDVPPASLTPIRPLERVTPLTGATPVTVSGGVPGGGVDCPTPSGGPLPGGLFRVRVKEEGSLGYSCLTGIP